MVLISWVWSLKIIVQTHALLYFKTKQNTKALQMYFFKEVNTCFWYPIQEVQRGHSQSQSPPTVVPSLPGPLPRGHHCDQRDFFFFKEDNYPVNAVLLYNVNTLLSSLFLGNSLWNTRRYRGIKTKEFWWPDTRFTVRLLIHLSVKTAFLFLFDFAQIFCPILLHRPELRERVRGS